jgi:hypothetical protein
MIFHKGVFEEKEIDSTFHIGNFAAQKRWEFQHTGVVTFFSSLFIFWDIFRRLVMLGDLDLGMENFLLSP